MANPKNKQIVSNEMESTTTNIMGMFSPEKISGSLSKEKQSPVESKFSDYFGQKTKKESPVSDDKNFFTTVTLDTTQNVHVGDNVATIATKIYGLFDKNEKENTKRFELDRNFEKERSQETKRQYQDIIGSFDDKTETKSIKPETKQTKKYSSTNSKVPKVTDKGAGKKGFAKKAAIVGGGIAAGVGIGSMIPSGEPNSSGKPSGTTPESNPPTTTQVPKLSSMPSSTKDDLKTKISGRESDNSYNIMNRVAGETESNIVTVGNKDINGKSYQKNLTDLTIDEVISLSEKRSAHFKQSGAGAAAGKYQFMPGTLRDMGLKAFGKEFGKEKFSEENQELLMNAMVDTESDSLKRAGIPVTDASLYMAHFLGTGKGIETVKAILNANDDVKMGSLMSSPQKRANASIASQTVGEYKSSLKKGGFNFEEVDVNSVASTPSATLAGSGTITSGFGSRTLNGKQEDHPGIDIAAPKGTQVNATADGTVLLASDTGNGYGSHIQIDHGDGIVTIYGHLSAIGVKAGDTVKAGQKIGEVGSTGKSTGNHLHYQINKNGKAQNPDNIKLSNISPVGPAGQMSEVATADSGSRVSSASNENRDLIKKPKLVSMNNPTNNVVGSQAKPQTLTAGSLSDHPLIPKFVMPVTTITS